MLQPERARTLERPLHLQLLVLSKLAPDPRSKVAPFSSVVASEVTTVELADKVKDSWMNRETANSTLRPARTLSAAALPNVRRPAPEAPAENLKSSSMDRALAMVNDAWAPIWNSRDAAVRMSVVMVKERGPLMDATGPVRV